VLEVRLIILGAFGGSLPGQSRQSFLKRKKGFLFASLAHDHIKFETYILTLPQARVKDCSGNPFTEQSEVKDWNGKPDP
jgi:hypothetical protein